VPSALSAEDAEKISEGFHHPTFDDDDHGQLRVKKREGKNGGPIKASTFVYLTLNKKSINFN